MISYGFDTPNADFLGKDLRLEADGATLALEADQSRYDVTLKVPGRHNASNSLAAIAATRACGVPVSQSTAALSRFEGLRRRLEVVGTADGVTVIDDFAHNPDKIAASLDTVRAHPGRLLIMFQRKRIQMSVAELQELEEIKGLVNRGQQLGVLTYAETPARSPSSISTRPTSKSCTASWSMKDGIH